MRRFLLATLAVLALAAPGALAQEIHFPPRKPLPYPQRMTGVGPVLASPPSARYLAYRYGYYRYGYRPVPFVPYYPVYRRPIRPLPYPGHIIVTGRTIVRRGPIVVGPVVYPVQVAPVGRARPTVVVGSGGVLIVRTPGAPMVRSTIPPAGVPFGSRRHR